MRWSSKVFSWSIFLNFCFTLPAHVRFLIVLKCFMWLSSLLTSMANNKPKYEKSLFWLASILWVQRFSYGFSSTLRDVSYVDSPVSMVLVLDNMTVKYAFYSNKGHSKPAFSKKTWDFSTFKKGCWFGVFPEN